jgi:hypothetical protein
METLNGLADYTFILVCFYEVCVRCVIECELQIDLSVAPL